MFNATISSARSFEKFVSNFSELDAVASCKEYADKSLGFACRVRESCGSTVNYILKFVKKQVASECEPPNLTVGGSKPYAPLENIRL